MTDLPTGTVTFLFTDIQGSTALWERHPGAMRQAQVRHDALLRDAIATHRGHVFRPVGDGFCAVGGFAHEVDVGFLREHHLEPPAEQRVVVHDHHPQAFALGVLGSFAVGHPSPLARTTPRYRQMPRSGEAILVHSSS